MNRDDNPGFSVCAVIPAYNHAAALLPLIRQVSPLVDRVIVVNDGSRDATSRLADEFSEIELVNHPERKGKGVAIRRGLSRAKKNRVKARPLAQFVPGWLPSSQIHRATASSGARAGWTPTSGRTGRRAN